MKKIIFVIATFSFLALLEVSFAPRVGLQILSPFFTLLAVAAVNFLEKKPEKKLGIFAAVTAGLFLDLLSGKFLGFFLLISLGLALFIKFVLKNYVELPQ